MASVDARGQPISPAQEHRIPRRKVSSNFDPVYPQQQHDARSVSQSSITRKPLAPAKDLPSRQLDAFVPPAAGPSTFSQPRPIKMQDSPSSPVRLVAPATHMHEPSAARYEADARPQLPFVDIPRPPPSTRRDSATSRASVRVVTKFEGNASADVTSAGASSAGAKSTPPQSAATQTPVLAGVRTSSLAVQQQHALPVRTAGTHVRNVSAPMIATDYQPPISVLGATNEPQDLQESSQLQYFHRPAKKEPPRVPDGLERPPALITEPRRSSLPPGSEVTPQSAGTLLTPDGWMPRKELSRPGSSSNLSIDSTGRGRASARPHSRNSSGSYPIRNDRSLSATRSASGTPVPYHGNGSSIDLLNIPYSQQAAQTLALDNAQLRHHVGGSASLLDARKTLEMYRANVKKTQDQAIQYEFAILMVNAASEPIPTADGTLGRSPDAEDLLREARHILQRLCDKGYPYAQYYLGDGYFSGLFNRGREDHEKAFGLFIAASKHGHAEAGYRAALCYEFGWGCRRDFNKAVQYYRQSASKGHPGAAIRLGKACITGDMGLTGKRREGVNWLKRAAEAADQQHNSAPFELGLLHLTGFDPDIFKDEGYAAQLFTQSAELGHAEASMRMGDAYEHGLLTCPRDPALSVHFYNGAAQAGMPEAMMALCAWYMVGAEPVLEKNEFEAYEWAKQAADLGFAKAEYAVGLFAEQGIGRRRDPLEANVWYVRAAEQGDERAKQRLEIIRAASAGETALPAVPGKRRAKRAVVSKDAPADDKDCIVM